MILVYDCTDSASFAYLAILSCDSYIDRNLPHWIDEVNRYANDGILKILVANKCDKSEEKTIEFQQAKNWAEKEGIKVMEISAKTGQNVEESLLMLTRQLYANFVHSKSVDRKDSIILRKDNRPAHEKKKGCLI